MTNICLFTSLFYAVTPNPVGNMANVFLFGLYGNLISTGVTYCHGFCLRRYYMGQKDAIDSYDKQLKEDEEPKFNEAKDVIEQKAKTWLYIFYTFTFLWFWGGSVLFIWNMMSCHGEISKTLSNYWVASYFTALLLDWLIFDPIVALLCKIQVIQDFCKYKGYIYDDEVCHDSYIHQHIKEE